MTNLKPDQERVKNLLRETITLLCKNGLSFKRKFAVEALVGVTLDDTEVFLVNLNEVVKSPSTNSVDSEADASDSSFRESRRKRKRKRKLIKEEQGSVEEEQDYDDLGASQLESAELDDEPSAKRQESKTEYTIEAGIQKEEHVDDDIVFIKEELEDSWQQSTPMNQSRSNAPSGYTNTNFSVSGDSSQGDLPLSEMTLVPVGFQEGASSVSQQRHQLTGSMQFQSPHTSRAATVTSDQMQQNNMQNRRLDLPYQCSKCDKKYKLKGSLSAHEKWHMGKYKYHCSICDKGFQSSYSLEGHMSWHTGKKAFQCSCCLKEFRYRQDVNEHIKTCVGRLDVSGNA